MRQSVCVGPMCPLVDAWRGSVTRLHILTARGFHLSKVATLVHKSTGEFQEVDGGDTTEAKQNRQYLYKQGWKRIDNIKCKVMFYMYDCNNKRRRYPERYHLLRLYDLDTENQLEGQTLQEVTARIQGDYEQWHVDNFYCVRAFNGLAECIHNTDQRALTTVTKEYLERLGYVEIHQQNGKGWEGSWLRRI